MSLSDRLGLLGRKVGMMRIYTDDGDAVPVTVLDVSNNRVAQIKTSETDGYSAIQVAFGSKKASRVNKPTAQHFAKAGVEAGQVLKEFRVEAAVAAEYKAGVVLPVNLFAVGQKVDVQGTSIGKGFTGTIKRIKGTSFDLATMFLVPSRWRRILVVCSLARRCLATSVTSPRLCKTLTSFA